VRVLIAGSTGFIGGHLVIALRNNGYAVFGVSRHAGQALQWDPRQGLLDREQLAALQVDAIVNLAGESVAERWSERKKSHIYKSRVLSTRLLAQCVAELAWKPKVFINASAIGFYGERGSEILTEDSPAGSGFLSHVCIDWEEATAPVRAAGIRTLCARFGIVFGTGGGALPRMLAPFHLGAGGKLGTGEQYMSWIAIDDAVRAIEFLLSQASLEGPVNVVSPNPVTNNEFTQTAGRILRKPTLMTVPATMAHLAFGREMADEVLLASDRVLPEKLSANGFQFRYGVLEPALRHILHDDSTNRAPS
jgi:uncharacterized protein (TIGR01777 family)